MDKAKIGITNVEFSGTGGIESATVKLELNIYGADTFSAIELLPKILTDIHYRMKLIDCDIKRSKICLYGIGYQSLSGGWYFCF
ncbi:Uncharacterised protein [Streptococcus pneumoniae]|nr:Uncharacterised protein [Streptococcus pneumoniae]